MDILYCTKQTYTEVELFSDSKDSSEEIELLNVGRDGGQSEGVSGVAVDCNVACLFQLQ